jgi:osmotically-inducible protein OsmY
MFTTTSRGLVAMIAAPVAAAGILAGGLGMAAIASASTVPAKSGMVLSKEFVAQQMQEQSSAAKPSKAEIQQQPQQLDSPTKQEHSQLMGNLKAEEQKQDAMSAVESQENDQPSEPKAQVYTLKTPVHPKPGMMHAGWSQMGG